MSPRFRLNLTHAPRYLEGDHPHTEVRARDFERPDQHARKQVAENRRHAEEPGERGRKRQSRKQNRDFLKCHDRPSPESFQISQILEQPQSILRSPA